MGDNYEDLVELGFEGIDRFAENVYPRLHKPRRWSLGGKHSAQPPPQQPQQPARSPPRDRDRDQQKGRDIRHDSVADQHPDEMYAQDRTRDDDRETVYVSGRRPNDRNYYAEDTTVLVRGRDAAGYRGGYDVVPRAPDPPFAYGQREVVDRDYVDRWGGRGRPDPRRRASSYSPPRRNRDRSWENERYRSKSPNHHRVAATIIGALAGGLLGNAAKHGSTATTVGGAVVGGLVAREGEKLYDRHEDKKAREEARRDARRREREYGYN